MSDTSTRTVNGRPIADEATKRTLDSIAEPLACSALDVALLAVVDALDFKNGPGVAVAKDGVAQPVILRTDRQAPFVARLLALNTGLRTRPPEDPTTHLTLTTETAWAIELYETPTGLFLRPGTDEPERCHDVAVEAREYLRYLASPEATDRWATPIPDRFTSPSQTGGDSVPRELRQCWRDRLEQESRASVELLTGWLRLMELPDEGVEQDQWARRLGVVDELYPLVDSWFTWLRDQGVLGPEPNLLRPTGTIPVPGDQDPPVQSMVAALTEHRDLIVRLLTGRASSSDLFAIEGLRPSRLAANEPDLESVWSRIGELVKEHGHRLGRRPAMADLGGATTDNRRLCTILERPAADITVLSAGRPYTGSDSFDVVIAIGALHRWADPNDAINTASLLVKPGGILIVLENTRLTPLGMLIAGLLENGFTDANGTPTATPTREAETWLQLLNESGFAATGTPVGPSPAVLIHGQRTHDETVRARRPADEPEPIRSETECEIARIWAQLLPTAPTTRQDDFFDLGGDSLLATRFIAAVRQRYGNTIAMRDLFTNPQLAAVAERVDAVITSVADQGIDEGVL